MKDWFSSNWRAFCFLCIFIVIDVILIAVIIYYGHKVNSMDTMISSNQFERIDYKDTLGEMDASSTESEIVVPGDVFFE